MGDVGGEEHLCLPVCALGTVSYSDEKETMGQASRFKFWLCIDSCVILT